MINIVTASSCSDALKSGVTSATVSPLNICTRVLQHDCEIDVVLNDLCCWL